MTADVHDVTALRTSVRSSSGRGSAPVEVVVLPAGSPPRPGALTADQTIADLVALLLGAERAREPEHPPLTDREASVLTLICGGLSNQDIAERLFLSVNSVKTYIRSVYRKIGAGSRSQAVVWGFRNGYA